jgi:hypothetical protein
LLIKTVFKHIFCGISPAADSARDPSGLRRSVMEHGPGEKNDGYIALCNTALQCRLQEGKVLVKGPDGAGLAGAMCNY